MYNRKTILSACILVATLLLLTATIASASPIQDRMKARVPALTELKAKGVIGENNQGYVEFLKGQKEQESVVTAENADRKKVYNAIGKKQGVDAGQVGSRRAQQLAQKGVKGHWYQDAAGKWSQK